MVDIEKQKDIDIQIQVAAYFLAQKKLPYNDLCWLFAEKQLFVEKGHQQPSKEEIKKKAEEVFNSFPVYDELCWLIAEFEILIKNNLI